MTFYDVATKFSHIFMLDYVHLHYRFKHMTIYCKCDSGWNALAMP